MRKKELGNLPLLKAGTMDKTFIKMHGFEFLVKPERKVIHDEKILVLNFYSRYKLMENNFFPVYRIFHSKSAFITQDVTDRSWTEQSMEFMLLINDRNRNSAIRTVWEEQLVKRFFRCGNSEKHWYQVINEKQEQIRDARQKKKRKRMNEKTDLLFKGVKPPTAAFLKWAEEEAMYGSRYVFYDYTKKKYLKCFCSHCKAEFEMEQKKLKHNRKGTCPICKSPVIFKAKGKSSYIFDTGYAVKIEKSNGHIILRHFMLYKDYQILESEAMSFRCQEFYRSVIENGEVKDFVYRYSAGDNRKGWYLRPLDPYFYYTYHLNYTVRDHELRSQMPGCLYLKNLRKTIKDTEIQYCAIEQYGKFYMHEMIPVRSYLLEYLEYPQLEYFVKMGLYRLAGDLIYSGQKLLPDSESKDMRKTLNISKTKIAVMKKYNLGLKGLTAMRWLEKETINLNEQETYNFTLLYDPKITTLIEYSEYAPIKKIMNYLLKQISSPYENERFTLDSNLGLLTEKQIREFGNCASDWMDYMEWSKELGREMQSKYVLFPKSLKLAHDKTMKEYQIHENKVGHTVEHAKMLRDRRKVNQILNDERHLLEDKIKKGNYFLKVPNDWKEIRKEGDLLGHCVGSYISNIAEGECQIYFLRKKKEPEKPFYTMEWANGKVWQCRGKGNCGYDDKVPSFDDYVERRLKSIKENSEKNAV